MYNWILAKSPITTVNTLSTLCSVELNTTRNKLQLLLKKVRQTDRHTDVSSAKYDQNVASWNSCIPSLIVTGLINLVSNLRTITFGYWLENVFSFNIIVIHIDTKCWTKFRIYLTPGKETLWPNSTAWLINAVILLLKVM